MGFIWGFLSSVIFTFFIALKAICLERERERDKRFKLQSSDLRFSQSVRSIEIWVGYFFSFYQRRRRWTVWEDKGRDLVLLGCTISVNTLITSWRPPPMVGGSSQLVFSIFSLPTLQLLFLRFRFCFFPICIFLLVFCLVSEKISESE